jgi:hypothetical protein
VHLRGGQDIRPGELHPLGRQRRVARHQGPFELHARLGFLLGAFKDRIEAEIVKNLDALLEQKDPVQAFQAGVAEHTAKRAAKTTAAKKPAAKAKKA